MINYLTIEYYASFILGLILIILLLALHYVLLVRPWIEAISSVFGDNGNRRGTYNLDCENHARRMLGEPEE